MKMITNTHLKKHQMDKKAYKAMYPNAILGKCNWFSTWRNSDKNKEHLRIQSKRVVDTPEFVEKRNANMKIATSKDSYRENLSRTMKLWAATPEGKAHLQNKPVTQRMRMSNFDRWVEDFGIEIATQKQLDWQAKNILPSTSRFTKIERYVATALKEMGYEIVTQLSVPHYYCDIFIPKLNLIVEVNGDFWHANPEKFSANQIIGHKNMQAHEVWKKDAKKIDDLKQLGYNVHVVWESQIKRQAQTSLVEDIVREYEKSYS